MSAIVVVEPPFSAARNRAKPASVGLGRSRYSRSWVKRFLVSRSAASPCACRPRHPVSFTVLGCAATCRVHPPVADPLAARARPCQRRGVPAPAEGALRRARRPRTAPAHGSVGAHAGAAVPSLVAVGADEGRGQRAVRQGGRRHRSESSERGFGRSGTRQVASYGPCEAPLN